jgi:hypothetical protein
MEEQQEKRWGAGGILQGLAHEQPGLLKDKEDRRR